MVGQTVAYVRVSSAEQNLDRQLEAVGECDRIFQDKISGSSRAKRTGLAELMRYVREGDLVKVASMDRLGRDTRDLYAIVDELTDKGCAVQFVSERITVDKSGTSPVDGLMLGILAAFAEFERRRIKERQAEGIAPGCVAPFQALLSMALPSPLWWSTALVRGPRALGAWHDRVSKSGLPGHA